MKKLTVSVIVHNDFTHIETALESLIANTQTPFDAYLTVNSGAPADVERIRTRFPQITILVNAGPRGFAANHNAILAASATRFTALLNDDIFLYANTLDTLVDYLEDHADAGLVGPFVENPDGTPQISVFNDPSLLRMIYRISGLGALTKQNGVVRRTLQRLGLAQRLGIESLKTDNSIRAVPVVVGVVMVVRRDAYMQAGKMDEDTRFYGEEFGWHLRLRRHGWKVVFVPTVRVTHFNVDQALTGWKLAEHRKAILSYFTRYKPRWQTTIMRLSIVLFHTLRAVAFMPFNRSTASDHWKTAQAALQKPRNAP